MGGEGNAEEGVPYPGPHDPSRYAPDHRPHVQDVETNPWDTIDPQPATAAAVAPQHTASGATQPVVIPGGMIGVPPQDPSTLSRTPPQTVPTADRLQASPAQPLPTSPGNENNPFLKKLAHETQTQPSSGQLGSSSPPTESLGRMSLASSTNTNPWGAVTSHGTGTSSIYDDEPRNNSDPWSVNPPLPQPKLHSTSGQTSLPAPGGGDELLVWGDQPSKPREGVNEKESLNAPVEGHWDKEIRDGSSAPEVVPSIRQDETSEGWNLIDHEPRAEGPPAAQQQSSVEEATRPSSNEQGPTLPPRVPGREATEMYHIIRIKWQDNTAPGNTRTSPILVQNANGPCPLVALVNALVLITPADATDTPLIQTLQSREQISIDLLLQAVVEELMTSPRRPSDAVFPDLTELYNFLKGLDTGMNANPRFVPDEELPPFLADWMEQLDPWERETCIPGGFEQTKEMELYSTFSIPLIHGWLPSPSDMVYESMKRRAESYEEAQHILFQEEELQEKLENPTSSGLTPEEQEAYQDILIIKDFLDGSATQLTTVGLEILRKAVPPGAVAILFRNDHFSTLYKHPETHVLLMLVSDSEFAGHGGTVWETFNDVTGKSEFLSGDFKPVRVTHHSRDGSGSARLSSTSQGNWAGAGAAAGRSEPPRSPNHVQEDEDFAMALQLQEEEEERHRQEQQQARQQRNRRLSEQYMDPQGRHPPLPSTRLSSAGLRRPGATAQRPPPQQAPSQQAPSQQVRPLVPPPRGARETSDEAPPSYDESANDAPFRPPVGHPSHPDSVPGANAAAASPRPQPLIQRVSQANPGPMDGGGFGGYGSRPVRRPVPASSGVSSRERDCTVM